MNARKGKRKEKKKENGKNRSRKRGKEKRHSGAKLKLRVGLSRLLKLLNGRE